MTPVDRVILERLADRLATLAGTEQARHLYAAALRRVLDADTVPGLRETGDRVANHLRGGEAMTPQDRKTISIAIANYNEAIEDVTVLRDALARILAADMAAAEDIDQGAKDVARETDVEASGGDLWRTE